MAITVAERLRPTRPTLKSASTTSLSLQPAEGEMHRLGIHFGAITLPVSFPSTLATYDFATTDAGSPPLGS